MGTPWLWFPYLVTKLTDQPRRGKAQRATGSDGGATSEQESSSSRLISVGESFDIVGGRPRTGASPTRVMDSSERSSEPIYGTVAVASGEQEANSQGRIRTLVVWGQGIPLRPPMTIRRPAETIPSQNAPSAMSSVRNDSRTQLKLMKQVSTGELKLRRQLSWSRPVGTDCALRDRVSCFERHWQQTPSLCSETTNAR